MIILILVGIIPCILATFVVIRSYKSRAVDLRESAVKNQCEILTDTLEAEHYLRNPDESASNNQLNLLSTVYSGRIVIIDADYRVVRDTFDIDTGKISVSKEVVSCFESGQSDSQYNDRNAYILMTFPLIPEGGSTVDGVMLVSVSTNEINQNARLLQSRATYVMLGVSLLVLVLGYTLSGILVRPFARVTSAIEDVADGYESEAVSVPDYSETVQITNAFNKMLTRVMTVDNSRQEFVSNVSHELKTPLASMKVLADSLNGQEDVPPELYREFMHDITEEIDRENNIISDLLQMVHLDRKAAELNIERTEIGELLSVIIKRLRPIAEQRDICLMLEMERPVTAEVDAGKLSMVFSNIIENAVKYNVDGGWVRVLLVTDYKDFYVTVTDCGLGIPADQQEHVYERFYRGDKSHSTEIEGTGLGLAIARSAVMLHRGNIRIRSRENEGTIFIVRIPVFAEAEL